MKFTDLLHWVVMLVLINVGCELGLVKASEPAFNVYSHSFGDFSRDGWHIEAARFSINPVVPAVLGVVGAATYTAVTKK